MQNRDLSLPGTSYRHLLLWKNGHVELTPPHDILTNQIREYLPGDPMLLAMMKESYGFKRASG